MQKLQLKVYLLITTLCGLICAGVILLGGGMQGATQPVATGAAPGVLAGLVENLHHPVSLMLLQLVVVIGVAKLLGGVARRFAQPAVIGEMIAGILLGPSLFGAVFPAAKEFLFPAASLGALSLLSQIGVILFMFFIGIELDLGSLRKRAQSAVMVSHVSIVVPFSLGCAVALGVYGTHAPEGVAFAPFALFMGIAMSITAFPVLARILQERGLEKTSLGSVALACAAVDDVTAWCILAVVVAIAKANGIAGALVTVALAMAYTAFMLIVVRPRLAAFAQREYRTDAQRTTAVVGTLVVACASALVTEAIGIHALFGAFLFGVILPGDAPLSRTLRERAELFAGAFLLPLFFAFTGLRTQVGMLDGAADWLLCAGIVAVAIAGKFGASTLAARFAGLSWQDSTALGALMNTRGLMELIVLNIGYDLGILSPRIFAIMVLMALITTLMAGPVLTLLARRERAGIAIAAGTT